MGFFAELISNPILMVPAGSWAIAQVLKVFINALVNRKFSLDRLFGDGGMPSGHSATVMALAAMVGIEQGFASPLFAVSAILAIIVMHDAMGVRREAGKHARSIISIVESMNDYFSEHDDKIKTEKLKVLVGHTPLQVVVGSLLGAAIAVLYYFLVK